MGNKREDWKAIVDRIVGLKENLRRLNALNAPVNIIQKATDLLEEEEVRLVLLIVSKRIDVSQVKREEEARSAAHDLLRRARAILEEGRLGRILKEIDYRIVQLIEGNIREAGRGEDLEKAIRENNFEEILKLHRNFGGTAFELGELYDEYWARLVPRIAKLLLQIDAGR